MALLDDNNRHFGKRSEAEQEQILERIAAACLDQLKFETHGEIDEPT